MEIDWEKLDNVVLQIVQQDADTVIQNSKFEVGLDISTYPSLKLAFDGFGDDGDDENMVCFALFVHKSSAEQNFVFPPHDQTPWAIVRRPMDEAVIFCWYDRSEDQWEVLEPETDNHEDLSTERIILLLEKIMG